MAIIKLNSAQVSFLFNNLDVKKTAGTWMEELEKQFGDFYEMDQDTFNLELSDLDALYLQQDMLENTDIILKEVRGDIQYHTYNDTSWFNIKWCLEMSSDVILAVRQGLQK